MLGSRSKVKYSKLESDLMTAINDGNEVTMRQLLLQVHPNMEIYGRSILDHSVESKHINIVKLILAAGADVDEDAMINAASIADPEMLKLLIQYGGDVNNSLLYSHVGANGDVESLALLLACADPAKLPGNVDFVYSWAVKNKKKDIVKLLVETDTLKHVDDLFSIAVMKKAVGIINYLVSVGYWDEAYLRAEKKYAKAREKYLLDQAKIGRWYEDSSDFPSVQKAYDAWYANLNNLLIDETGQSVPVMELLHRY